MQGNGTGLTDTGRLDPHMPDMIEPCRAHGSKLHLDASFRGGLRCPMTGLREPETHTGLAMRFALAASFKQDFRPEM